jgi:mRNA interferase MazF
MSFLPVRGEVWRADLNPQKGSEQQGTRPVVVVQVDLLNRVGNTVVVVPFTSNVKRASLPSAVLVLAGLGGLANDSVALCHQVRVLDKTGLLSRLGALPPTSIDAIEDRLRFVLGL